ncbi:hypothetical protein SBC1_46750 (plasmid) [Caballeronia sp. SBC1]|nr:hypothetical protein SBC2_41220 [Caballeronia sp. SBC2]QIN64635.1 hypothetical protein SBC1_46750 [Caballeronia sp. SBC1]
MENGKRTGEYIDTMVRSIVGLQTDMTRLAGESKLSQNKGVRDIQDAGKALKARDNRMGDATLERAPEKQR